jgi:hypothetical protein
MMGAITHPAGSFYGADKNNFTPRAGLSWNFAPKFVFRGSFGMFTQDVLPTMGQEEYTTSAAVQQPSGNPYPAFYLSQGPGTIPYKTNSNGTSYFLGTNYSSRSATYVDPQLRNPYTMTWSAGFQWQFQASTLAELVYQGAAGVGLTGSNNINVLPQSIFNSTDTTLLKCGLCEHARLFALSAVWKYQQVQQLRAQHLPCDDCPSGEAIQFRALL